MDAVDSVMERLLVARGESGGVGGKFGGCTLGLEASEIEWTGGRGEWK